MLRLFQCHLSHFGYPSGTTFPYEWPSLVCKRNFLPSGRRSKVQGSRISNLATCGCLQECVHFASSSLFSLVRYVLCNSCHSTPKRYRQSTTCGVHKVLLVCTSRFSERVHFWPPEASSNLADTYAAAWSECPSW
jgi:hypothetical protein